MLRNLDEEFRGNGLPDEPYSRLGRNGAGHVYEECVQPFTRDVKIGTPDWALEIAAVIGAGAAGRIEAMGVRLMGVRLTGDTALPSDGFRILVAAGVPHPANHPRSLIRRCATH